MMLLTAIALAGEPASAAPTGPASAEAPAAPDPNELPPLVKDPVLLQFIQAPYPEAAKSASIEGKVVLAIEIDAAGKVVDVQVERAAGNGFDEAAVEAAKQFTFSPAEDAAGPVPVVIEFEYGFVLDSTTVATAVPESPLEKPVNLDGMVVEMGTRRPLPEFVVRIEPLGVEATTDAQGAYNFRGLDAGHYTIRVVHPGYDALAKEVDVTASEVTSARLWLRNQSYADAGVIGTYRKETADVTRRTITMEEIRRIPGTFGDPIRVVQSLPGAARSPFGTGLLIIRGADPQDSSVYVDGIRIPYIYHLGGFESVINPDLVQAVDYLPGGFGPHYGRSIGGIVDVTTKQQFPERTQVRWSTDLLDSGVMVAGSVGKNHEHGFGVAARRSYIDAILPLFLDTGFVVKPAWWDYQAKYQWQGKTTWKASLLAFGFEDTLTASTPPGYAQGTDQDSQGDLGTRYSTHRIIAAFSTPIGDNLDLRISPSLGNDAAALDVGNAWRLEESRWVVEVRSELGWQPNEHLRAAVGVDFIGGSSKFTILLPFDPSSFAETDPLAEREPFKVEDTATGWGPDPYISAEIRPLADPDAMLIAPGLRFMYVSVPGELAVTGLDPRLSARWRFLKGSTLKGSVGLYHQPPQPFQSYRHDDTEITLGSEQSFSSSVGFEQQITPAIHADVEGFYKDLSNLIVNNPNFASLDDQFFTNEGVGRVMGLEVMVRHDPIGKFFGWISYTLSRSERQDHPKDDWYLYDYDQTHILTGLAGYTLPFDINVSAKAQYTTGNPTTPYNLGVYDVDLDAYNGLQTGAYNAERLPPYWTVSARIDKLFTFKSWQLDLYLDLLNALHGENPEFEIYNYDYTEHAYISGLPFIPSPGFEARFEF